LSTVLSGKFMVYFERIRFCSFAVINIAIAHILMGLSEYITDTTLFLIASGLSRFYSGMTYGMVSTFAFSQTLQFYAES